MEALHDDGEAQISQFEKRIAVLAALATCDEQSLTPHCIFEALPVVVARAIVRDTTSWYMAEFDRKHWRSIYLEQFIDLGFIQIDPADSRRYQITDKGYQLFEAWLQG